MYKSKQRNKKLVTAANIEIRTRTFWNSKFHKKSNSSGNNGNDLLKKACG